MSSTLLGLEMETESLMESRKDHRLILKGKRTKRSRPSTTSSSSSGCSGGGKAVTDAYFSSLSPTNSGGNSTCTEEDEDMANCLILLAQSGNVSKKELVKEIKVEKFSSRKLTEVTAATTTTGKAEFFVYECKTCSRSFPSFQALGGHRASHKRPKPILEENKVVGIKTLKDKEDQDEQLVQFKKKITSPSLSHQETNKQKSKLHECSICGSEFSSGQALGGHMRRHRSIPTTTNIPDEKPRNALQLDLNLPAPEDDPQDSELQFVFSGPALVGVPLLS